MGSYRDLTNQMMVVGTGHNTSGISFRRLSCSGYPASVYLFRPYWLVLSGKGVPEQTTQDDPDIAGKVTQSTCFGKVNIRIDGILGDFGLFQF